MPDPPTIAEQSVRLTRAALDVLTRESLTRDGLSALSPLAQLALSPTIMLPMRSLAEPSLADYLEDAGLPQARATRLMRTLSRPGPIHGTLAARLAEAEASPVRLRELTVPEASEYLGFLAKLV